MDKRREAIIRAMNPPEGTAWDAESQELHLLLYDLSQSPPDGWIVQYEVSDGNGANPRNLDVFANERRRAWREHLHRRHEKFGDPDDLADIGAIPTSGHHALLVLRHVTTGAEVRRWVDREELRKVVVDTLRSEQDKAAALRTHAAGAVADCLPRVARKRAAIVERILSDPEVELAKQLDVYGLASEMRETTDPDAVIDELIARVNGKGDTTEQWLRESSALLDAAIEGGSQDETVHSRGAGRTHGANAGRAGTGRTVG